MRTWTYSRTAVAVAATVTVGLLTACGGGSDQGGEADDQRDVASEQQVENDDSDPDAQPQLLDPDGLVAQHEFLLPAPDDEVLPYLDVAVDEGVVVIVELDGIDARVVWTALPCRAAPEVEVTGGQDGIVVAIDRGPQVVEPGDPCDASQDFFAVDLVLRDDLQDASFEGRIR